jgi:hypothetical protein
MDSRKISKTKFIEGKIQKVFEEFDKLKYCGFALNNDICYQMLYFELTILYVCKR